MTAPAPRGGWRFRCRGPRHSPHFLLHRPRLSTFLLASSPPPLFPPLLRCLGVGVVAFSPLQPSGYIRFHRSPHPPRPSTEPRCRARMQHAAPPHLAVACPMMMMISWDLLVYGIDSVSYGTPIRHSIQSCVEGHALPLGSSRLRHRLSLIRHSHTALDSVLR
jgi:hypothetical protein